MISGYTQMKKKHISGILVVPRIQNLKVHVPLTEYCAGDKIEEIEMGGTCCTYGEWERWAQGFGGET